MRFVGDIVAMVVAETKAQAVDAAEAVIVDYDPLPAVVDRRSRARPDAPRRVRGAGLERRQRAWAPARSRACSTTPTSSCRERIVNQRVAPVPMEPAGIVAVPGEPAGGLTFWVVDAGPARRARRARGASSASTRASSTARNAAVGGGFGAKAGMIVEYLLVAQGRARCSAGR